MLAGANRVGDSRGPVAPQAAPGRGDAPEEGRRLLALRRAQRGGPTLGDAADEAFAEALAGLPDPPHPEAAAALERVGEEMGRHVYARRVVDDALPEALRILSEGLAASRVGSLLVEESFHRSARVRLVAARPAAARPYVAGVLRGFLSDALNCAARVRLAPDGCFEVALGEGCDVNRKKEGPP